MKVQTLEELDLNIDAKDTTFDIIIVPDADLQKRKRDQITPIVSLISEAIGKQERKARVFKYTPNWRENDKNIWTAIVYAGDRLVDALVDYRDDTIRPLLFISYGFGGLVTKRAIGCIAERKRSGQRIEQLYQAAKELVFIGVPHPATEHPNNWPRLNTHLIAYGAFKKHDLDNIDSHVQNVAFVIDDFTNCVRGGSLVEHIYTIYETQDTEYSSRRFLPQKKKTRIVGKEFSSIAVPVACPCESYTDYFDMALFRASSVYKKLVEIIETCATKRILTATRTDNGNLRVTVSQQDAQSARSIDTPSHSTWPPVTQPASPHLVATPSGTGTSSQGMATPADTSPRPSASLDMIFYEHRIPQMPCHYRKQIDRNNGFVDRPDILSQIDGYFLTDTDNDAIHSFALCGFGGIGKTQLAMHYAFAREAKFDAIFWVAASEPVKVAKSFQGIAQALGLVEDTWNGDPLACRDLVLEWLSEPRKMPPADAHADARGGQDRDWEMGFSNHRPKAALASWLLIFDNADDLDCVREYWPRSSHGTHRSCILVTSRSDLAKTDLAANGLDLQPMSAEQCVALLLKQVLKPQQAAPVVSDQTRAAAAQLAEAVGYLPLAMTIIAARVRESRMSISDFWHRHSHGTLLRELSKVTQLPPREQYPYILRTVWRLDVFPPKERGMLNVMAFLDNGAVPGFLLEQDVQNDVSEMGQVLATPLSYPQPADEYIAARSSIMQTSLAACDEASGSLSWHKLVQDVVADEMASEDKAGYAALAVCLLEHAWTFRQDRFTGENVKDARRDELLPHVLRIPPNYGLLVQNQALLQKIARKLASVLQSAGLYLVQKFQFTLAKPLFELAMNVCQEQGDALKGLLADTSFSYARFGASTNMDPKTIFHYCQQFHDICRDLDDGSEDARGDVATSCTSMGQGYLLLDQPREAVEQCQRCIDIEKDQSDHVNDGAISQFALIYQAWGYIGLGEHERAAQQAQYVIDYRAQHIAPEKNDKDSDKLGLALQCLGRARERQGRIHDCVNAYSRAMANYRDMGGRDNFRFAQMSLKLGEHYSCQPGHAQFAPELIRDAIRVFRMHHYYEPELARALFKMHQYEARLSGGGEPKEDDWLVEARQLHKKLRPASSSSMPGHHPGPEDFDQLVRFWSR